MPGQRPADLDIGAFSDNAPWLVSSEPPRWMAGLAIVRERTRAEVPALVRPRRFPPWRRITRVSRKLGWALGAWYLTERRRERSSSHEGLSRRLRVAFQELGPTYIKLGQILSSGEGIFPPELVGQFKQLRDRVPAEPFTVVRGIVEADLARPLEEVFSRFSTTSIAAASIAQVHAATLRSGEEVVVKVQRPRVAELVRNDLAVMSFIAPHLVGRIPIAVLANPPALIELFAETIVEELDFRLEAESMLDIAKVLAKSGQRAIIVPRPHPSLVTRRVLVMERLDGFSWDDVAGMREAGIDTEAVLRAGVVSFLEGAMLYGVFHGDLHGGNLVVRADGRVALLDFGITGRLDQPRRLAFLRLVTAGTMNDVHSQVLALRDLGALRGDADVGEVVRALGLGTKPQDVVEMSAEELTAQLRELTKQLLAYGARMPKELMLFVKDLLFLDGAVAAFAPDVDLLGEIAGIATYFATRHGERIAEEIGIDPRATEIDLDGVRASLGVSETTDQISYRQLAERRALLRAKFEAERGHGPESADQEAGNDAAQSAGHDAAQGAGNDTGRHEPDGTSPPR